MARRKQQDWKPATEFKVVKLRPNGPKEGQSYASWSAGKDNADRKWERTREANFNRLLF